ADGTRRRVQRRADPVHADGEEHEREQEPEEVARVRDFAVAVAAARESPVREQSGDAGHDAVQRFAAIDEYRCDRCRDDERDEERRALPVHASPSASAEAQPATRSQCRAMTAASASRAKSRWTGGSDVADVRPTSSWKSKY